jgi:major membrane immunogen (membrane-anchored lipoprotein)
MNKTKKRNWAGKMVVFIIISMAAIFGNCACGSDDDDGEGCLAKYGVIPSGQESSLNGNYTVNYYDPVYEYSGDFSISLKDGKVTIVDWEWFCYYSDAGYIGFYSINGDQFIAIWNSAPGAPIPCEEIDMVSDKLSGVASGNTINGTWTELFEPPETYEATMTRYSTTPSTSCY